MAKPRVFIASTHNDLRFIRAAFPQFIESLGYEPVLFERDNITYENGLGLDESCYRAVESCDIFVLIIGQEYGSVSPYNNAKKTGKNGNNELSHVSITVGEYQTAVNKGMPIYVLVEKSVFTEYQTWLINKDKHGVKYAYVESVNVFILINAIYEQGRNLKHFEKFGDIEVSLREQWAGYFHSLLNRRMDEVKMISLNAQLTRLTDLNQTLQTYLEEVVKNTSINHDKLIASEKIRLAEAKRISKLKENYSVQLLSVAFHIDTNKIEETLKNSSSENEFWDAFITIARSTSEDLEVDAFVKIQLKNSSFRRALDDARLLLGVAPFYFIHDFDIHEITPYP